MGGPFAVVGFLAFILLVVIPIHELGLSTAWVTGGGYKYLQLGEGNAALRIPPHAHGVRPAITGWFAEFDDLTGEHEPHGRAWFRAAHRA